MEPIHFNFDCVGLIFKNHKILIDFISSKMKFDSGGPSSYSNRISMLLSKSNLQDSQKGVFFIGSHSQNDIHCMTQFEYKHKSIDFIPSMVSRRFIQMH